jgi:hypothetical protein
MNKESLPKSKKIKSLSLCVLGVVGATLITFSQEPAAPAGEVKVLTLQELQELRKTKAPEEINKMILENNADPVIQRLKANFNMKETHRMGILHKYPSLTKSLGSYKDVAKDLFQKDRAEEVSLYEHIEKIGLKQSQQELNLCSVYSVFHTAQYAYLEAGLTPPTVNYLKSLLTPEELVRARKAGNGIETLLFRLAVKANQETGKTLKVLDLRAPTSEIMEEMIRTQVRNKRACVALTAMVYRNNQEAEPHWVMIAGFGQTKGKENYWKTIDSNISTGGRYQLIGDPFLGEAWAIWFE